MRPPRHTLHTTHTVRIHLSIPFDRNTFRACVDSTKLHPACNVYVSSVCVDLSGAAWKASIKCENAAMNYSGVRWLLTDKVSNGQRARKLPRVEHRAHLLTCQCSTHFYLILNSDSDRFRLSK